MQFGYISFTQKKIGSKTFFFLEKNKSEKKKLEKKICFLKNEKFFFLNEKKKLIFHIFLSFFFKSRKKKLFLEKIFSDLFFSKKKKYFRSKIFFGEKYISELHPCWFLWRLEHFDHFGVEKTARPTPTEGLCVWVFTCKQRRTYLMNLLSREELYPGERDKLEHFLIYDAGARRHHYNL